MPSFNITSPDGQQYKVTAPDGATQEQVLAYAQAHHAERPADLKPQFAQVHPAGSLATGPMQPAQVDELRRREPGIDYETGIKDLGFQANFSTLSTPDEKQQYLDRKVGPGNHGIDQFRNYYVKPAGGKKLGLDLKKPTTIANQNPGWRDAPTLAASMAGDAPAAIGMAGGGLLGGVLGAGAGAGIGRTGTQLYKSLAGLTTPESVKGMPGERQTAFVEGMAGELGGKALGKLGKVFTGAYSPLISQPTKDVINKSLVAGYTPTLEQGGFGPLLQRVQGAGRQVFGDYISQTNSAVAQKQVKQFLREAGLPDIALDGALQDISTQSVKVGEAGKPLIAKVKDYLANRQRLITDTQTSVKNFTTRRINSLQSRYGQAGSDTLDFVRDDISRAQSALHAQVQPLYDQFRKDSQGLKIVSTAPLKRVAEDLENEYTDVKFVMGKGTREYLDHLKQLPENIDPSAMNMLRKDAARDAGLDKFNKSTDEHFSEQFRRAATVALDDAEEHPLGVPVIGTLKQANQLYRDSISKFKAPEVELLMREASATRRVDPERLAAFLTQRETGTKAERVFSLLQPETQDKVRATVLSTLLNKHTIPNAAGIEQVSGYRFYQDLKGMGTTLDALYGKDARQVLDLSRQLAAADGKLAPSEVKGGIRSLLENSLTAKREHDVFMETHYLADLSKPGKEAEAAVDYIFQPQSQGRIKAAKEFYGENSPEIAGLRTAAMQNLLTNLVSEHPNLVNRIIDGDAFKQVLRRYGEPTLSEMFGRSQAAKLTEFANIMGFLTQKQSRAGSIVASMLSLSPLSHKGKLVEIGLTSQLLTSPKTMDYLVNGIKYRNSPRGKAAIDALSLWARSAIASKTQVSDPTQASVFDTLRQPAK